MLFPCSSNLSKKSYRLYGLTSSSSNCKSMFICFVVSSLDNSTTVSTCIETLLRINIRARDSVFLIFTPLSVNYKKLHHSGGQNNYLMFSSFQPFSFASSFKVSGEFASALWIASWVLLFTTIMLLGSKALLGSSFFRVI